MAMDFNVARMKVGHALHSTIFKTLFYTKHARKKDSNNKVLIITFAMSYMTEILNSQSMKVSSGYEILSLSTY